MKFNDEKSMKSSEKVGWKMLSWEWLKNSSKKIPLQLISKFCKLFFHMQKWILKNYRNLHFWRVDQLKRNYFLVLSALTFPRSFLSSFFSVTSGAVCAAATSAILTNYALEKKLKDPTRLIRCVWLKPRFTVGDNLRFRNSHEDLINNRIESKRNEEFYSLLLSSRYIIRNSLRRTATRITTEEKKYARQ